MYIYSQEPIESKGRDGLAGADRLETPPPEIHQRSQKSDVLVRIKTLKCIVS